MRAGPDGLARIAALIPGVSANVPDLLAGLSAMVGTDMRLPASVAEDLHPCLLLAATHPEQDGPGFEAATALLLGDLISGGLGPDDLAAHWDTFAMHYRAADAPVRAALMQGFALCHALGHCDLAALPQADDLRTFDPGMVRRALLDLARRMSLRDIGQVAAAGGPLDRDHHLAALNRVLGPRAGLFPPAGTGFPAEVVEMAATDPDAPGHASCLALICLNALIDRDADELALGHWARGAAHIRNMPPQSGAPIWAAFRLIYETQPEWDPFWLNDAPADNRCAIPSAPLTG